MALVICPCASVTVAAMTPSVRPSASLSVRYLCVCQAPSQSHNQSHCHLRSHSSAPANAGPAVLPQKDSTSSAAPSAWFTGQLVYHHVRICRPPHHPQLPTPITLHHHPCSPPSPARAAPLRAVCLSIVAHSGLQLRAPTSPSTWARRASFLQGETCHSSLAQLTPSPAS